METKTGIPKEALAALLRLEAKQVLRGFKSELFPTMTERHALALRGMSEEQMEEYAKELISSHDKIETP